MTPLDWLFIGIVALSWSKRMEVTALFLGSGALLIYMAYDVSHGGVGRSWWFAIGAFLWLHRADKVLVLNAKKRLDPSYVDQAEERGREAYERMRQRFIRWRHDS